MFAFVGPQWVRWRQAVIVFAGGRGPARVHSGRSRTQVRQFGRKMLVYVVIADIVSANSLGCLYYSLFVVRA